MGIADLPFDLCLWNKRSNGIDNNYVNRTRTSQYVYDLKSLFTGIWLRAQEVINVYTEFSCVDWIKSMFGIHECTGQTLTLSFGNNRKSEGSFTRGLWPVDLDNTTTRQTTHAQSDVETKGTCRNNIDIHCPV